MNKGKMSLVVLVPIVALLLSACGTSGTPIPLTATATLIPPTETPIPPTATSMPLTSRITGRVFIFPSDKSLVGAVVTLADAELKEPVAQAIADEAGRYLLEGMKPGMYSLSVM